MSKPIKANLAIVDPDLDAAAATLAEAVKQSAPMVQRLSTHRDRVDLALKELESERFDLISRRDLLRRQVEAVEQGLAMHIADIEATMQLYERGLNSQEPPQGGQPS
jgi:chromosome segregation ATPase